jgi:hypothetical protein
MQNLEEHGWLRILRILSFGLVQERGEECSQLETMSKMTDLIL